MNQLLKNHLDAEIGKFISNSAFKAQPSECINIVINLRLAVSPKMMLITNLTLCYKIRHVDFTSHRIEGLDPCTNHSLKDWSENFF